jgi:hypothetical protein
MLVEAKMQPLVMPSNLRALLMRMAFAFAPSGYCL